MPTGGAGNDTLPGGAGPDTIDGGAGVDTVDYSRSARGVHVSLPAGTSTVVNPSPGYLTSQPAMLTGENGYAVTALFTSDVGMPNGAGGGYTAPTNFDGIGAMLLDADTVRLFINHEINAGSGSAYQLSNGAGGSFSLTGARIDYVDLDRATFAVVGSGVAYDTIMNRSGSVVRSGAELDQAQGLARFCSGSLFEADQFGNGHGIVDAAFFAGQEIGSGTAYMLDAAGRTLWSVPAFGYGSYENVTQLDTGNTTHVAFLLGSDRAGSPAFLYIGEKSASGDFLDRNGLKSGQMFVWKTDSGDTLPAQFMSGARAGSWVPIAVQDASKAGQSGYDAAGYKTASTLQSQALALGAFSFARPEDSAVNPVDGRQAVFAATGGASTDPAGAVYVATFDFTSLSAPRATFSVLYDGDADAALRLRNPDNVDWADDGFIYVQEDAATPSLFAASSANLSEASIVRIDPATGELLRVAHINRGGVPTGYLDTAASTRAVWESSGILDVSSLFGQPAGSLLLSSVQGHSVTGRDSQVAVITSPDATVRPASDVDALVSIENVIGSAFRDTINGDAAANVFKGGGGADRLLGNGGDDALLGDGMVMPTDSAMSIYRLYIAVLGRTPDDGGWAGWTSDLDAGTPLASIAGAFVGSPEFHARHGALSNDAFVRLIYGNALERAPDPSGLAAWTGQLAAGMSRGEVAAGIADSAEARLLPDPELHAGQVFRLYDTALDRTPDAGGFLGWIAELAGKTSLEAIADAFVGSAEFGLIYGSASNDEFVTLLYENALGRAPEAAGFNHWMAHLAGGASRASVMLSFSESAELQASSNAALLRFMRTVEPERNDTLEGGIGNDTMSGGAGADTFVFRPGQGADVVWTYEAWDTIQMAGFGYADKAAALAHMSQSGGDVLFADQGTSVTLHGATLAQLQAGEWLLS